MLPYMTPMRMPTTASISDTIMPMNSELRVPAHSRAHRSWPMALVPSQCAALGYLFFSGRPLAPLLYCPGRQG